jgi:hypothetical protein
VATLRANPYSFMCSLVLSVSTLLSRY